MRGTGKEEDFSKVAEGLRKAVGDFIKNLATPDFEAIQKIGLSMLPSLLDRMEAELGTIYRYAWKNNEKRATMHNRWCFVIARGKQNSALIEFLDNGQREIVSRNALRRVQKSKK